MTFSIYNRDTGIELWRGAATDHKAAVAAWMASDDIEEVDASVIVCRWDAAADDHVQHMAAADFA